MSANQEIADLEWVVANGGLRDAALEHAKKNLARLKDLTERRKVIADARAD